MEDGDPTSPWQEVEIGPHKLDQRMDFQINAARQSLCSYSSDGGVNAIFDTLLPIIPNRVNINNFIEND